jgi:hypothetical protein
LARATLFSFLGRRADAASIEAARAAAFELKKLIPMVILMTIGIR